MKACSPIAAPAMPTASRCAICWALRSHPPGRSTPLSRPSAAAPLTCFPANWPLLETDQRHSAIAAWLDGVLQRPNVPAAARAAVSEQAALLAADPPLPLFILLEAALDPEVAGRHMGVLGSIIVGEVIGRCLAEQRERLEPLAAAAQAALPETLWQAIDAIRTMPDLVRFVAAQTGLADCRDAPFI